MDSKNSSNQNMGGSKYPDNNCNEDQSEATVDDVEEFESVSAQLDDLNGILDTMESNVDNIKDQLLSILESNREILKELKEENEKSKEGGGSDDKQNPPPMEASS